MNKTSKIRRKDFKKIIKFNLPIQLIERTLKMFVQELSHSKHHHIQQLTW